MRAMQITTIISYFIIIIYDNALKKTDFIFNASATHYTPSFGFHLILSESAIEAQLCGLPSSNLTTHTESHIEGSVVSSMATTKPEC